jgi:hypothetical protein
VLIGNLCRVPSARGEGFAACVLRGRPVPLIMTAVLTRIVRFVDAQSAKCAEDYAKDAYGTKCMNKVTIPTEPDDSKAKADEVCQYGQDMYACFPPSCCEDASMKEAMKKTEDYVKETLNDCTLKCGGSAGLRAGALTIFLVATLALLASQ